MDKMVKSYQGVIKESDEEERTLTVLISTPDVDRMGEVVEPMGVDLEDYKKNPVVLWCHKYDQPPIAKSLWIKKTKEGILAKPQFALTQFASEIYHLYKDGFLNCWSVGFMPKEWKDGDGEEAPKRKYIKSELLEYSAVPVPANPQALTQIRTIVKSVGLVEAIEEEEKKLDDEILKPEETEDTIRIPAPGEAEKHDDHRIRTISISEKEGIKALYCGECKVVITYLFDKDKGWTMEKAKAWVKEHHKKALDPWETLTLDVADLDMLIEEKAGAVLNKANKDRLRNASALILEVLKSAETEEEQTEAGMFEPVMDALSEIREAIKEIKPAEKQADDKKTSGDGDSPEKIAQATADAIARALQKEINRQLGKV